MNGYYLKKILFRMIYLYEIMYRKDICIWLYSILALIELPLSARIIYYKIL